jgi:serine/threonine protein kinase
MDWDLESWPGWERYRFIRKYWPDPIRFGAAAARPDTRICRAKEIETGRVVAVKFSNDSRHEYEILQSVDHCHCLPALAGYGMNGQFGLVLPFANGETLCEKGVQNDAHMLMPIFDLLGVLVSLHEDGLVHQDIKPDNVFFLDGRVVLADFGHARFMDVDVNGNTFIGGEDRLPGTDGYRAPEMVPGGRYDEKVDIFALGQTLAICTAVGLIAVENDVQTEMLLESKRDAGTISGAVAALLREMLRYAPSDRISAREARQAECFRSIWDHVFRGDESAEHQSDRAH